MSEKRAAKAERRAQNIRNAHPGDAAAEKRAQKAERRAKNIREYASLSEKSTYRRGQQSAERRARKAERKAENIRIHDPDSPAAERRAQKADRRADNIRDYHGISNAPGQLNNHNATASRSTHGSRIEESTTDVNLIVSSLTPEQASAQQTVLLMLGLLFIGLLILVFWLA